MKNKSLLLMIFNVLTCGFAAVIGAMDNPKENRVRDLVLEIAAKEQKQSQLLYEQNEIKAKIQDIDEEESKLLINMKKAQNEVKLFWGKFIKDSRTEVSGEEMSILIRFDKDPRTGINHTDRQVLRRLISQDKESIIDFNKRYNLSLQKESINIYSLAYWSKWMGW